MSLIFQAEDIVTLERVPMNWGTQEQLKEVLGKDLKVLSVEDGGQSLLLSLGQKLKFGNVEVDKFVVHHSWVSAQLTIEEIK